MFFVILAPNCLFDTISLALAQRNGVEPPKKSAFLAWWLHRPRERYKSVDYTFLARLGEGLVRAGAYFSMTYACKPLLQPFFS